MKILGGEHDKSTTALLALDETTWMDGRLDITHALTGWDPAPPAPPSWSGSFIEDRTHSSL